jgi:KDO2-lipid IV(A) lauroyltransferase
LLLTTVTGLVRALPLPIGYRLADLASEAHRICSPERRRAVEENLAVLLGAAEPPERAVRAVFRNYGRLLLEILRGPDVPEVEYRFRHLERLREARQRGRGVIVALPHTGSWNLGGARLAARGIRLHAVAATQLNAAWSDSLRRRQEAAGIGILGPGSVRSLAGVLARNEVLALLVDGDVFRRGVPVAFAGRDIRFPAGPARLAARTGAALLPAVGARHADGSLSVEFLPEVRPEGAGDAAIVRTTAALARTLEEALRADPGQWMIFRRFFVGAPAVGPEVAAAPARRPSVPSAAGSRRAA